MTIKTFGLVAAAALLVAGGAHANYQNGQTTQGRYQGSQTYQSSNYNNNTNMQPTYNRPVQQVPMGSRIQTLHSTEGMWRDIKDNGHSRDYEALTGMGVRVRDGAQVVTQYRGQPQYSTTVRSNVQGNTQVGGAYGMHDRRIEQR